MKRNLLCIPVFAGLLLLTALPGQAQRKAGAVPVPGNPEFNGTLQQIVTQKTDTRLSPELKNLYESSQPGQKKTQAAGRLSQGSDVLSQFMQISGNNVVVDITVKDDLSKATAELQKMGLQVTGTFGRVISGLMPISALSQLESAGSVRYARPAFKPLHHRMSAGSISTGLQVWGPPAPPKPTPVISQGDTAQRSYLARKKYNVNGNGVKVGILSDSYNNLGTANTGVLHGELPGRGNPFNFRKPVQVLLDLDSNGTDEGRAMAEIVHDVAPGAELAFNTADKGMASFAQGIVNLAKANCDVIVDDVSYFAEPFFQDGIIAQAVDQVKKKGVTYFSAAGNEGVNSYESVYRPTLVEPLGPGGGFAHNFSGPGTTPRYFEPVYIPPGGGILIASFQWDQSSASASGVPCESDYDIYLSDLNGRIVAAGASDNFISGDPIEVFGYQNFDPSNYTFFLTIVKFAGPDAAHVKHVMFDDAQFFLTTNPIPGTFAPSLVGHAKAEGAIATGAAWYLQTPAYGTDTAIVDYYSSEGGVANYYDIDGNRISPLVRKKPEIVAPDGGNTSFFDPFGNGDISQDTDTFPNFFGTSAAAPHAAGVAALMIEAQKLRTITPAQIKGILSSHTSDMDDPNTTGFDKGFDFATGTGLIKADAAVGAVKFPNSFVKELNVKGICSTDPSVTRNWEISNPNPFDMDVSWFVVGSSQHGKLTVPPGTTDFSTNTDYFHHVALSSIVILDWEDNFGFSRFDLATSSRAKCGSGKLSDESGDELLTGSGNSFSTGTTGKPNVAEVYPNPSANAFRLYLSLNSQQNADIELFSIDGKRLQTKRVAQSNGVIDIDASGYRPGVYILRVTQGGFIRNMKLIKQ